jgi:hypothetical protein
MIRSVKTIPKEVAPSSVRSGWPTIDSELLVLGKRSFFLRLSDGSKLATEWKTSAPRCGFQSAQLKCSFYPLSVSLHLSAISLGWAAIKRIRLEL